MRASSINEVISILENVVADSIARNDRFGYFAALYHHVTCRIREGIEKSEFEDGRRMEKLDVIFANRYLQALDDWRKRRPVSGCWKVAFEAAENSSALVMQHLLLGMNAHINLDLGIAAVETMKSEALQGVKKDFYLINNILASLVAEVQKRMGKVSPLIGLLKLHRTNADEMLINFSITTARDGAWCFAQELAAGNSAAAITRRDRIIEALALNLAKPSGWLKMTIAGIKLFEYHKPANITRLLQGLDLSDCSWD